MFRKTVICVLLLFGLVVSTGMANADGTKPVYKGTGWVGATGSKIYSIHPGPYKIAFASTTARDKIRKHLIKPAAQITNEVGVEMKVTKEIIPGSSSNNPGRRTIIFHYKYRPVGKKGVSVMYPWYDQSDGSAFGGHVVMNSEHWKPGWFSSNPTTNLYHLKNGIVHEFGHFALAHPNYDRDGDGKIENYECVYHGEKKRKPVLCAPRGGYMTSTTAGTFTIFDIAGLKQMRKNYDLR